MIMPSFPAVFSGPPVAYRGPGTFSCTSTVPQAASRFVLQNAVNVASVNIRLAKVGSPTSMTCTVSIQTESSGVPSGTNVTNGTVSFTPTATGWSGTLTFTGNAALAANTSYWLVVSFTSTGTFDGSNYYNWYAALDNQNMGSYERQFTSYTSGAWITPPTTAKWGAGWLFTLSTGQTWGNPYYNATNVTIAGSTRIGLSFSLDTVKSISGVWLYLATTGASVNALAVTIYADGSNTQYVTTTYTRSVIYGAQTSVGSNIVYIDFGGSTTLPAGKYWISLYSSTASNSWNIGYMLEDLDAGAVSRGGTLWEMGTRTADTGSWTVTTYGQDPIFGLIINNEIPSVGQAF